MTLKEIMEDEHEDVLFENYIVVHENDAKKLSDTVQSLMGCGWQPVGGVSVSSSESDDYKYIVFAQALVK